MPKLLGMPANWPEEYNKNKSDDTLRLDFLQSRLGQYTGRVICRDSNNGRGLRLHETSRHDAYFTVRAAIDAYMRGSVQKNGRIVNFLRPWPQEKPTYAGHYILIFEETNFFGNPFFSSAWWYTSDNGQFFWTIDSKEMQEFHIEYFMQLFAM